MSGWRYLIPVLLVAACLATIGTVTAVSLFRQQSSMTSILQENVASRRAAVELEECLTDLIALENAQVETVTVLHERVAVLLAAVDRSADQDEERELYKKQKIAFDDYLSRWQAMPPQGHPNHEEARREATQVLETSMRPPCEDFILYNGRRIDASAEHHERILRQLAWGMGIVGGVGAIAGIVLGFGVARGLQRSIYRLRVQIQDAAGKLNPSAPDIVVTGEGSFHGLHDEVERLTGQIEEVIRTLQQREHEVLRAEQLAAVGQLAAGVGHEIRNPLTSIKMLVQASLADNSGLEGDDLRIIEAEVRRMEQSLQTFLNFARLPKAERKPTDLAPLLADVAGLLKGRASRQRVDLRVECEAAGLPLIADSEQLRQVLVNLGLNALDAMPRGGTLLIRVEPPIGNNVTITVSDTGVGIAPGILPRLFEPFVSGKETGLGLGLAISRRLIEGHGGTLTASNPNTGGAEFRIVLPLEDHDAQAARH